MNCIFKFLAILLFLSLVGCKAKNPNIKLTYYDDGGIASIMRYKDGKLNGQCMWFYLNGNVEQVVSFKNGVANGEAVYFHKSGSLKSRRHWNDDLLNGFVTDYKDDSIGIIETVVLYEAGKIIDVRRKKE